MKKDIVVLINGSGGCGKSTFIDFCKTFAINKDKVKVWELSTVDWVKDVARFCGWNDTKKDKDRKFLHDLKMALEEWDDSPNQSVISSVNAFSSLNVELTNVFFVNVREIPSLKRLKELFEKQGYPTFTLLIKNPNVPMVITNDADKNVEAYSYDMVIYNKDDLNFLEENAKKFLNFIIGYFKIKRSNK